MNHDLAIIGTGSAALAAAIHGRRKQLRVIMIEREQIGGTCVNGSCHPVEGVARGSRRQAHRGGASIP